MRVLLVTNGLQYGGAERLVEALALDLTRAGDSVGVVATTRDGPIGQSLRQAGIRVQTLGIRGPWDTRAAFRLARIALRAGTELIHSHLAVSDITACAARLLMPGIRLVSTIHNRGRRLPGARRALWRSALRRFDKLVAVSDDVGRALPGGSRLTVLRPSLVDPSALSASKEEARRTLGVPSDVRLIVTVARLVPVKGLDVLATAARAIDARIIVIGDGPERERLRHSPLELIGARDDIDRVLPAADVIALPSRSEAFPQVALQAMAACRPVVASGVGGLREIVSNGETGLLVPPENPQALAAALNQLIENPERAVAMGTRARARLLDQGWTRPGFVHRVRAVHEEVVNQSPTG